MLQGESLWDILHEFLGCNFVFGLHTLKNKKCKKKGSTN